MSSAAFPGPPSIEVATLQTNKVTGWISIDDAATWLGMGKRFVEELVAKHEIVVKKFGTRTRILFSSLQDWAARQPDWRRDEGTDLADLLA